jgi:hypothetical protein
VIVIDGNVMDVREPADFLNARVRLLRPRRHLLERTDEAGASADVSIATACVYSAGASWCLQEREEERPQASVHRGIVDDVLQTSLPTEAEMDLPVVNHVIFWDAKSAAALTRVLRERRTEVGRWTTSESIRSVLRRVCLSSGRRHVLISSAADSASLEGASWRIAARGFWIDAG